MTDSPEVPAGKLLDLKIISDPVAGKLHYNLEADKSLTEGQQYELAVATDKIMRGFSPRYNRAVEQLDALAAKGRAVEEASPLIQKVVNRHVDKKPKPPALEP